MNCVIVLTESNGKYPAGHYHCDPNRNGGRAYTPRLQDAKVFATREQAQRELCEGNEKILPLSQAFGNYHSV